jgi:ubiquinol-cytochrome c reductase cytochrome b subunit
MWNKLKQWLDVRYGLNAIIQTQIRAQILDYRIPKNINIFYTLGFLTAIAFCVQALTGILLLLYYIPHPDHAFSSVQDIMTKVPYGWLFREMHTVGSNLLITIVLLHMVTVFLMGNYKRPRELTWLVGGLALIITMIFGYSGHLLPWTQLSYWSTTVVTSIPTAFPVVGETIARILRGGDNITGTTLSRFFELHIAILPLAFLTLMGIHLFLIYRTGISATPFGKLDAEERPLTEYKRKLYPDGYPYYPSFFQKQMYMMMAYFAVMFFIITFLPALFFPPEANIAADPFKTPHEIRPAWYLLAQYELLKLIPNKFFGIALQMILAGLFLFWPFLDTQQEKNLMKRPVLRGVFVFVLAAWVVLLFWGRS